MTFHIITRFNQSLTTCMQNNYASKVREGEQIVGEK